MVARLRTIALPIACALGLSLPVTASAREFLFTWDLVVDDQVSGKASNSAVTNDIRRISELIDTSHLQDLFPGKDLSDPLSFDLDAALDLRGVPAIVSFDRGEKRLVVSFPFLEDSISFEGADRDDALDLFEDWLEGELDAPDAPNASLTQVLQEFVARSAVDPIAGNPNSLQSKMFEAAYVTGTTGVFRAEAGTPEADEWTGKDLFRIAGRYERFYGGPWKGNAYELGLDYQLNLRNPKFALLLDLPFILTDTEGSESFLVSAGVGVLFRPTHWWNITPSFRFGGAGSFKLGAVAFMPSANLTSSMRWTIGEREVSVGGRKLGIGEFELGLGNMFGWSGTYDGIEVGGHRLAYDLNNYALRNGIDVTKRLPLSLFGAQTALKLFFVDTWILGSPLFLDHYDELGVQLSTQRLMAGKWHDRVAFHAAWVFGNDYDALQLRLSLRF